MTTYPSDSTKNPDPDPSDCPWGGEFVDDVGRGVRREPVMAGHTDNTKATLGPTERTTPVTDRSDDVRFFSSSATGTTNADDDDNCNDNMRVSASVLAAVVSWLRRNGKKA